MKSFFKLFLTLLVFALLTGCEKNPVNPEDIELLKGRWSVEEESEYFKSQQYIYEVTISISPQDFSRIIISNFYQLGTNAEAIGEVQGNRIQLLENQTISGYGESYAVISGDGTITDDFQNINWSYSVDDGSGNPDNATAIYTKINK